MSWFVGKKYLTSGGKRLVTQTHANRSKPDMDHIDTLYNDMILSKRLKNLSGSTRTRSDSVIEPQLQVIPEPPQYDCDLSVERDVYELIDAVTKLLRYTDLSAKAQRELVSDLRSALGHVVPREKTTMDKSLTVSAILHQADNITLPDDELCILPLVCKIIAVIQL